jgi:hypothetical protein
MRIGLPEDRLEVCPGTQRGPGGVLLHLVARPATMVPLLEEYLMRCVLKYLIRIYLELSPAIALVLLDGCLPTFHRVSPPPLLTFEQLCLPSPSESFASTLVTGLNFPRVLCRPARGSRVPTISIGLAGKGTSCCQHGTCC